MNKYLIEFLGTFALTFVILYSQNYLVMIGFISIIYFFDLSLSGGRFNPAIAIAYLATGKISSTEIIPFILSEIAGALAGVQLVKLIT